MTIQIPNKFDFDTQVIEPRSRPSLYRNVGKPLFDIALAVVLLPLFGLIVLLVSPFILRDGGPLFFAHKRVGAGGRTFRTLKLRTMVPDAEARLRETLEANPEYLAEWKATFKLTNDPRISRIGRILRKLRIDELPQIWNILKGEMSWVGPRPVTAEELLHYGSARSLYTSVRPGASGLWQVSDQHAMSHRERVALDADYVRKMSFATDFKCVVATVGAILKCSGK